MEREKKVGRNPYPEFNLHVNITAGATTDALLPSAAMRIPDEVGQRRWVDVKLNGGRLKINLLVIGIADLVYLEGIVAAPVRLNGEFSPRSGERLVVFLGVLRVPLRTVVDLERRRTVENKGGRDTNVSRTATTEGWFEWSAQPIIAAVG